MSANIIDFCIDFFLIYSKAHTHWHMLHIHGHMNKSTEIPNTQSMRIVNEWTNEWKNEDKNKTQRMWEIESFSEGFYI